MNTIRENGRFIQAVQYLPPHLRRCVMALSQAQRADSEELRLRIGRPMSVLTQDGEHELDEIVTSGDLDTLCSQATSYSRYASETLRQGYVTGGGGCRIGFCGTAVQKNNQITYIKNLSSAVIRIAGEKRGIAIPLLSELRTETSVHDTLILSPPGGGKTTLLRDLIRLLSDGDSTHPPLRIGLIDERSEIAAVADGVPQMDVGRHTDVMDACPKAEGISMVLRAMRPNVIAVDEITVPEDILAMTAAANCGVKLLATIHALDVTELRQKPLYAKLLDAKVFTRAICIETRAGGRCYRTEVL